MFDTATTTPFDPAQLYARRKALGMTREELGAFLRLSPKTLEKWELGVTRPADAALGYLRVFLADPVAVGRALGTLDLLRGRTVDFDLQLEPAVVLSPDPVLTVRDIEKAEARSVKRSSFSDGLLSVKVPLNLFKGGRLNMA